MHQTNEQRVREALMHLLGPVDHTWVAEQVGVERQSVWHWSHGKHTSQERLDQVAAAIRTLLPEHEEAAPPDWARRLETMIYALTQEQAAQDLDGLIGASGERLGLPAAEAGAGQGNGKEDGSPGSKRPAP